jgi:hypothetical protein
VEGSLARSNEPSGSVNAEQFSSGYTAGGLSCDDQFQRVS